MSKLPSAFPQEIHNPRVHPNASATPDHPRATLHSKDLTVSEPPIVRSLQLRARNFKQQSAEIFAYRYTAPSSPTLKMCNTPTLKRAVIHGNRYFCAPPQPVMEVIATAAKDPARAYRVITTIYQFCLHSITHLRYI